MAGYYKTWGERGDWTKCWEKIEPEGGQGRETENKALILWQRDP